MFTPASLFSKSLKLQSLQTSVRYFTRTISHSYSDGHPPLLTDLIPSKALLAQQNSFANMSMPLERTTRNANSHRPNYDMTLPLNPSSLTSHARSRGLPRPEAAIFANVALQQLRSLHEETDAPVSAMQIASAMRRHAVEEVERGAAASQEEIEARGVTIADDMEAAVAEGLAQQLDSEGGAKDDGVTILTQVKDGRRSRRYYFSQDALDEFFGGEDPYDKSKDMKKLHVKYAGTDIVTAMCQNVELAMELGKHLHAEDILNLYCANRMFHGAVNQHLLSSIKAWIAASAPEAGEIFSFKLYRRLLVVDPAGRTYGDMNPGSRPQKALSQWMMQRTRVIPGLRYLQLVLNRDRCCREIIAILARNGHRCPPRMHSTLLRLWLLMDISTTRQRQAILRNTELWTDVDLYNAQFLFTKLAMAFNDPVYGPSTNDLLILIMGQKGLYPLWQLLMRKKYTTLPELLDLSVRYSFQIDPDHWTGDFFSSTSNVHGVPYDEAGTVHLEGWGMGEMHLMRPDELVPLEAVTRGLELDQHIRYMMVWGHVDFATGENLVPTEEEMYISDDERVLAHMDTTHHWRRKHVLKKRWHTLSLQQQRDIFEEDEDDRLRAMGWCGNDSDYDEYSGDDDETPYTLDDEINRGFIVQPQPKDHKSDVPAAEDQDGWASFVNKALMGLPPQLSEDEVLQAQAWHSYQDAERNCGWDWHRWLGQQREMDGTAQERAVVADEADQDDQMQDVEGSLEDDEWSESYFSDDELEEDLMEGTE